MQKLTASRIKQTRRGGNWSGVGAGKTVASVLASLVIGAKVTVVVAFNSNLRRWEEEIRSVCPTARIIAKERGPFVAEQGRPTFILLNYESFQQPWGEKELVPNLTDALTVDFIVLDEIQSVRQRSESEESQRRKTMRAFLDLAARANSQLCVLGMSATPVINNLVEARTTLELVTGQSFENVPTKPTVANAARFHQQMIRHGLRFRPKHSQQVSFRHIEIDGTECLDDLKNLPRRGYIPQLERILLRAKLPELVSLVRPGTLIYTQFVTEMVDPLVEFVRNLGLSVGTYTGAEKEGLDQFLRRQEGDTGLTKVDVLVGSSPVGTGIDGLQTVCDRLIFACLPWTSAEFEQIIGRLTRLGGAYDRVSVFIPIVRLSGRNGKAWSWDRYRLQCIEYKRTLADAVVDGAVPEGRLPSREEMYEVTIAELQAWMQEVESDPSCSA